MGWARKDYVISTKIYWGGSGPNDKGLSRKHVVEGTKVLPACLLILLTLCSCLHAVICMTCILLVIPRCCSAPFRPHDAVVCL